MGNIKDTGETPVTKEKGQTPNEAQPNQISQTIIATAHSKGTAKHYQVQRNRVVKMLQEAGPKGVNTLEFRAVGIMSPAARIWELIEQGYDIRPDKILPPGIANPRRKIARYVLISLPKGRGVSK